MRNAKALISGLLLLLSLSAGTVGGLVDQPHASIITMETTGDDVDVG